MGEHRSNDFKLTIVRQVLENNKSIRSLAKQFDLSSRSIRRWIAKYQENGNVKREPRDVEAYKVHQKHVEFALKYIGNNNTVSMKDLDNILRSEFEDYDVTPQWLGQVLRANNQTRKRLRKYHDPKKRFNKPIDRAELKRQFYGEVKKYPLDHIISLDETAVQLQMTKSYARCHIGKRCVLTTTDNSIFKSYTLIVAITANKIVGWRLFDEKGTTTERLEIFLKDYVTDQYQKHLVVMDNAGAHRNEVIRKAIEASGNKLLYSVLFYPRSNGAVEALFSQLKHYLRDAKVKTFEELHAFIGIILKSKIKPIHLRNYFAFVYGDPPPLEQRTKPNKRLKVPPKYKEDKNT